MTGTMEYKLQPAAMQRQQMACTLSLKQLEAEGVFAGYASVFNVVDSQQDIILPGAFKETLQGRVADIKLLWQHDMREPIGMVEEMREDRNGLYVKGRLLLEVARAREAYALLKQGIVSGLSIGYTPRSWKMDAQHGIRRLHALDLWEISLVTFPANEAARITVVKQASNEATPHALRQWQKDTACGNTVRLADALQHARTMLQRLCD